MSDTVRQEYEDKLGAEFGAVFHGLWNDWAWGLMRANEFRELFGSAENVGLLNAISFAGLPNEEDLEREIAAAAGEPEPEPVPTKPALPARFTRKSTGWK